MNLWYVRKNGQTRGPSRIDQISREILLGRIRENDYLSTDREQWHPLSTLPQLVPEVMRNANTEEGRQRLILARLRADDRSHARRGLNDAPAGSDRRQGDRRSIDSFETLEVETHDQDQETEGRNLLLPAALIMVALFILAVIFLW